MASWPPDKLVWVDVETTGLDPLTDDVIEIGMAITSIADLSDDSLSMTANSWVINPGMLRDDLDQVVIDMHTENGLWDEVRTAGIRPLEAEKQILAWLKSNGVEEGRVPMCGSSVHFDRKMLAAHYPLLEDYFHYRNLDVSSLKCVFSIWHDKPYPSAGNMVHRAIHDVKESISEFLYYKQIMLGAGTEPSFWDGQMVTLPLPEPTPWAPKKDVTWKTSYGTGATGGNFT